MSQIFKSQQLGRCDTRIACCVTELARVVSYLVPYAIFIEAMNSYLFLECIVHNLTR